MISHHRFTVVRECTYPAIVGMDLFPALNVKLQLGNNVYYDNQCAKNTQPRIMCKSASPTIGRIFATRNVKIPPRTMFVFEGMVKVPLDPGTLVMVDAALDKGSERLGLGCGRVLDTARDNGRVLMHMVNPGTSVCEIQKGTCVGTLSTVVEDAVVEHVTH